MPTTIGGPPKISANIIEDPIPLLPSEMVMITTPALHRPQSPAIKPPTAIRSAPNSLATARPGAPS